MDLNYEEVPNIITGKDLDYLSDMFTWNYTAYKKAYNCIKKVEDEQLAKQIEKASDIFYENMQDIIEKLGGINE